MHVKAADHPKGSLGLRRQDLDFEHAQLSVQQSPMSLEYRVASRHPRPPVQPDAFSNLLGKRLTQSALPAIRFHHLRHTHRTLLRQAGIDPKVVSERLGQATVSIILTHKGLW